jgi:glycosyltransferase involved in cell wall biosynthesis
MPFSELGDYYRAADIAAWLTNESTSMLDAAACGIPIIVSDRIYQDHVVGNGLSYKMNDLDSLCDALRSLQDEPLRRELGNAGAKKMRDRFSWEMAAKTRLEDFNAALDAAG